MGHIRMVTIISPALWATLALLILAYVGFGIGGVVGVVLAAFLLRNFR